MSKYFFLFIIFFSLISCEYPCEEYNEDWMERGYYDTSRNQKYDRLYADMLMGTWDCYYPMIMTGIGDMIGEQPNFKCEFKQIKFSRNTCDILIAGIGSVERNMYTFKYLYDGKTIKFSRNNRTIIFTINGFLYPELYLRDSFGRYVIKKVKTAGC